jgi:hypothetical protein
VIAVDVVGWVGMGLLVIVLAVGVWFGWLRRGGRRPREKTPFETSIAAEVETRSYQSQRGGFGSH